MNQELDNLIAAGTVNAELALAAYGKLLPGITFEDYIATLKDDADMTQSQAGNEGMTATAGGMRAFMLGGSGVDHLTGGEDNNWQWRLAA